MIEGDIVMYCPYESHDLTLIGVVRGAGEHYSDPEDIYQEIHWVWSNMLEGLTADYRPSDLWTPQGSISQLPERVLHKIGSLLDLGDGVLEGLGWR